jgi:hypothetical protein
MMPCERCRIGQKSSSFWYSHPEWYIRLKRAFPSSPKWEGKRGIYSWNAEGESCSSVVYPSMPKTAK